MFLFLVLFVVALVFSSIGFKKYVWFISIGYGLSVAAIGVALLIAAREQLGVLTIYACVLFIVYGLRLGSYLAFREIRSQTYNSKMKTEIKSGADMSVGAKCAIWISAALLYAAQTSPVAFRLANGGETDTLFAIGLVISLVGLILETAADLQKNAAKKADPSTYVSTGLFRMVRCPNYFGEMLVWIGVFVGGILTYANAGQWIVAVLGFAGIIYVMFSGARRLEIRQNRTYGDDPEYQEYVKTTPIMIPLVPIYSVERHKWLVG